ncbi:dihydroorotase [Candidatus Oleimmundimicrobium sp.]|uniref:dihydroorotase n=1 Tax=Candidatus Oleimmundimicrobium sp. TaxID=3060597 RepID=UPI00272927F7|nr:dihydroorotase [Candidatus Oleimmundimicrobium sp.]MDO8885416.1 dihydroorotase [Candidatus Oleimmundimicrobium sp.]
MKKLLIKKGRVIDPANNIDDVLDVLVEDGKIASIGKNIKANGHKIIDAQGKIVSPGLIDMHVHLREPGREDEETIESGCKAAAVGGFSSIACMPNTEPVNDNPAVTEMILETARKVGLINVYPVAAITKKLEGKELAEMAILKSSGAITFSDDGNCVQNSEVMRRALEYSKMFNISLISHPECQELSKRGQVNEGYYSTILGLKGIPSAAEEVSIARDIILAELTNAQIHFTHVSTKGSIRMIKEAKERGLKITCDAAPHHLILTDETLLEYDTNYKVNPPLRGKDDLEALNRALSEGVIDAIASDHAPHAIYEKNVEFALAPFGMIGLETTLPLMLTKIVGKNILNLSDLISKLTVMPAKILNIDKGTLSIGSDADITIINSEAKVKIDTNTFLSKSKNSPFNNWELNGAADYLIVKGNVVVENRRLIV